MLFKLSGGDSTGSIPAQIMRAGSIRPFAPNQVYGDLTPASIERLVGGATQVATDRSASPEATVLGADDAGRPVMQFEFPEAPQPAEAQRVAQLLVLAAQRLKQAGIVLASPSLVGGPMASLIRGESVVLRWANRVAVKAAL